MEKDYEKEIEELNEQSDILPILKSIYISIDLKKDDVKDLLSKIATNTNKTFDDVHNIYLNNLDYWELLKKYWFRFLDLNKIKMTVTTAISCLHVITGVICMNRECFLGTERTNEDLRNHYLRADDSRTGKGLMSNLVIMVLKSQHNGVSLIDDKYIEITKKLTEAGLIGGWEGQGKNRRTVFGTCSKLFAYIDEFQKYLENNEADDVLGTIRMNCNNYKSHDNWLKNSARHQHDFPGYNGKCTFMVSLIGSKLKKKKYELIEDGTIQRFDIDFDEITLERSAEILEAMKTSIMSKEQRMNLHVKQRETLNKIVEILANIPNNTTVYINDDYLNQCIDKVSQDISKHFTIDKKEGKIMHSLSVNKINLIKKYAARIAIVRRKKSVSKLEIEEAFNIIDEKFRNLIEKSQLFEEDADEKFKWIRDCRSVLGKNSYTKSEIRIIMSKYWKISDATTIDRLKRIRDTLELDKFQTHIIIDKNGKQKSYKKYKLKL